MLSRKSFLMNLSVVFIFIFGAVMVSAQGNGNGNGGGGNAGNDNGGNGDMIQDQTQDQDCTAIQDQTQDQTQLQDCTGDCTPIQAGDQNANQNGGQNASQNGSQSANQNGNQYQYQYQYGEAQQSGGGNGIPVDVELTDDVTEALSTILLSKYATYDTYSVLLEQFGEVIPFVNMVDAEAIHSLTLEDLLLTYGLELPEVVDVEVPEFETIEEACAWAYDLEVEKVDLYDEYLELVSDYPDMSQVFTNLRDASLENHIPVLEACSQ